MVILPVKIASNCSRVRFETELEAIEYLDQFKEVLPTLSSYLSERKIYRDAVVESKSVLELKNQKAKTEIDSLLSEISTYIS